jgi:hypothetical protein
MNHRTNILQLARTSLNQSTFKPAVLEFGFGFRYFHNTMDSRGSIRPAARVAARRQDVWYVLDHWTSLNRFLPNFSGFPKEVEVTTLRRGNLKVTIREPFPMPVKFFFWGMVLPVADLKTQDNCE